VTTDDDGSSPKPPPPIDQDSPDGDPARRATPFTIVLPQDLQQRKQRRQRESAARGAATEQEQQAVVVARAPAPAMGGEKQQQRPALGRPRRMRVAQVLHSILTCGGADAVDDAAHRPVVPRRSAGAIDDDDGWQRTPLCPGMDGCGIQ
jgi:hypothetical protein